VPNDDDDNTVIIKRIFNVHVSRKKKLKHVKTL